MTEPRPAASTITDTQLDQLHDALDGAYRERAHLVALLAALHPSHIGYTDPAAIDWLVVTIETPTGQMSWHIAERDRDLFEHVRLVPATHNVWDGHTTEEKYRRLRALTASALPLIFGALGPGLGDTAATEATEPAPTKDKCDCPPTNAGLELCPACPGRTKEQP